MQPVQLPEHRIETRRVADLVPADYNPRKISPKAMEGLKKSLAEFGAVQPIVVNERTGHIVGGHQRVKALAALGQVETTVIVVDLSLTREKALNVALNNPHIAGEFDDGLGDQLDEINGEMPELFTDLRLDELLAPVDEPKEGLTDPDETPEPPQNPVTRAGDVWVMGAHRLACGDSTNADVAYRATGGASPSALFFDPPWDINFPTPPGAWLSVLAFSDGQRAGDVVRQFGAPTWVFAWDCQACWYTPGRPLKRMKLAMWFGDVAAYKYDGAHYGVAADAKTVTNSRGTYKYVPDSRGKHLADLFAMQLSKLHADGEHKHEKPCDWVRCLIGCCTSGSVFDPCCGSGVTLIACEQLNRACFAVELVPANVDVAVTRWQTFTGKTATLDGDGRTFDEIAAERATA